MKMKEPTDTTIMSQQDHHGDEHDCLSATSSTDSHASTASHPSRTPQSAVPSSPPPTPVPPPGLDRRTTTTTPSLPPPPALVLVPPPPPTRPRTRVRCCRAMAHDRRCHALPAAPVRIAVDTRTRSSRLFFVLLHLVGVSTIVPSSSSSGGGGSSFDGRADGRHPSPSGLAWLASRLARFPGLGGGIVGARTSPVLLSRLRVESSPRGLRGVLDRVERARGREYVDSVLLGEPLWFQDGLDGTRCLSPYGGGFGECGDATLWRVRRRGAGPSTKRGKGGRRRAREPGRRGRGEGGDTRREDRSRDDQPGDSSVCVWPFFCERDSQVLQPARRRRDPDEVDSHQHDDQDEDEDGEEEGFALQLVDLDASRTQAGSNEGSTGRRRGRRRLLFWNSNDDRREDEEECLLSFPLAGGDGGSALQIGSCSAEAAWAWHVNRDGVLVRGATEAEKRRRRRGPWRISPVKRAGAAKGADPHRADYGCVHRADSALATLLPCGDGRGGAAGGAASPVEFSLVRYPSPSSGGAGGPRRRPGGDDDAEPPWEPWTTLEAPPAAREAPRGPGADAADGGAPGPPVPRPPGSRTRGRDRASAGAGARGRAGPKPAASMLRAGREQGGGKAARGAATSASHIRDAPIAMNGVAFHRQRAADPRPPGGPSSAGLPHEGPKRDGRKGNARGGGTPCHEERDGPSEARGPEGHGGADANPHRPRKIPVHPYIQSSKDFVWVDPLTSLEYPTDLCRYLGHTKKEAGRHTLMGVGQYYRTAFNIKVYGVALYVAKRDVLADPKFGEYATLSSEDLRGREDFYDHLMNMPSTNGDGDPAGSSSGGFFDRTLLVKINMQLSTDAMRKSLEADWSLLTDEMKALIIDSSFEERESDERMRRRIQSKENGSNCSCGQTAPPEYKADPSCCARGTELAFTWRKDGDFEIRLDGRVVDAFPRPDVARGIFAEYLNGDPISPDARARFADGFPFLLAPLAQVGGISSAGAARGMGEELDRLREEALENAVALQREGMEMLGALIKQSEGGVRAIAGRPGPAPAPSPFSDGFGGGPGDGDAVGSKATPPEIMPDEIGIKIEPTMNFTHQLFFTTVHVYLLLLLVLSLPGSYTTTRFVVVKRRILETKKFFVESQSHGIAAMSKLHR